MLKTGRRIVSVFIADTNRLKTQLMVAALERSRPRVSVVGSALDSLGTREGLREHRADVAIISADLGTGLPGGLDLVRELKACHPTMRFITLVDSTTASVVAEVFRAGVDGLISRDDSFEVLCKSIYAVHEGQVWANSEQLHFVMDAFAKTTRPTEVFAGRYSKLLTERESHLVQLVTQGLTNRAIAQELHLSEHTVRNYLFRIFNKLGTSNRLELALYAINRKEAAPPVA